MTSHQRLGDITTAQLRGLCQVADIDPDTPVQLLSLLLGPVADRPVAAGPSWPSGISDDHSPIEHSFSITSAGPSVRLLAEATTASSRTANQLVAARGVLEGLGDRLELDRRRFDAVQELFLPSQPLGFGLWVSCIFARNAPPRLKVYFNPASRGQRHAPQLVRMALDRLGLPQAYRWVAQYGMRRGTRDRVSFFALDLDHSPTARIKVYISHDAATAHDVEYAATAVAGAPAWRIREFCDLAGGGPRRYTGRPLVSAYSFPAQLGDDRTDIDAGLDTPRQYTVYLPIRDYVRDDEDARRRVARVLRRHQHGPAVLPKLQACVQRRPLTGGAGLYAHLSCAVDRHTSGVSGTTIYLSSEAYRTAGTAVTTPAASA